MHITRPSQHCYSLMVDYTSGTSAVVIWRSYTYLIAVHHSDSCSYGRPFCGSLTRQVSSNSFQRHSQTYIYRQILDSCIRSVQKLGFCKPLYWLHSSCDLLPRIKFQTYRTSEVSERCLLATHITFVTPMLVFS